MSRNYKFHNPEGLCLSIYFISQKINYTHQNPIEAGLVFPEDYRYISAVDYSDEKGLLDDIVVFRMFDL